MTDIEKHKISISVVLAVSILISAVGLGFVISDRLNTVNNSIQDVRTEMHAAIDSVKSKQTQRAYQSDLKFQKIENKLDRLAEK